MHSFVTSTNQPFNYMCVSPSTVTAHGSFSKKQHEHALSASNHGPRPHFSNSLSHLFWLQTLWQQKNTQLTQEDVIVIVPFESILIAAAVPDVHEVQRDPDHVVAAAAGLDPQIGPVVWEAEGESK